MSVELYDEHEQSQRVQNWLKENGISLIMGVVLALAAIFGWRQWQNYQAAQADLASDYYTSVQLELQEDRLEGAVAQLNVMREAVASHSYTKLATMQVAASQVENDQLEPALALYQELFDAGDLQSLEPVVRLRLAQLYAANDNSVAAIEILSGAAPIGFESLWLETRGDLMFDQGELNQAENYYQQAVDQLRGEGGNFRSVETKLNAVRSTTSEPVAAETPAAESS
ncbi:MAG: tetratricopeptide repeat protein [Pseudomonadota bacterium]